ncbi:MAG: PLDc_N domain-containing protein [Chloroflexi bacterium]|nr:MAG: PLDc_N domain-containing protein [Chloroflexota bacterium]
MYGLFHFFGIGMNGLASLATIFWIWVLIDCLVKEPSDGNDKVAWTLFILFAPLIGALVYYFVRRPERIKAVGH